MHFSSIFILASVASATAALSGQRDFLMAKPGLFERQTRMCQPVEAPYTCERSCGAGYVQCISYPTCYNPGLGETCCSNGEYCPAEYYCTNGGCCPNGTSLADCGATIALSVIPPPPAQVSTAAPVETSSSAVETASSVIQATSSVTETVTTTTEAAISTSTTTSTSTTSTSTPSTSTTSTSTPSTSTSTTSTSTTQSTSTPPSSPSPTTATTTPPPTSTPTSNTSTTASIAIQTANAGQKQQHGSIVGFALGGGLGLALWL